MRTVRALETLASGPASASQLGAALQIHERTARRMLYRLVDEGYVVLIDSRRRRYGLTPRLLTVASEWLEHNAAAPSARAPE